MKMAAVQVGMRLESDKMRPFSPITVTEITERGFKYKLDAPVPNWPSVGSRASKSGPLAWLNRILLERTYLNYLTTPMHFPRQRKKAARQHVSNQIPNGTHRPRCRRNARSRICSRSAGLA